MAGVGPELGRQRAIELRITTRQEVIPFGSQVRIDVAGALRDGGAWNGSVQILAELRRDFRIEAHHPAGPERLRVGKIGQHNAVRAALAGRLTPAIGVPIAVIRVRDAGRPVTRWQGHQRADVAPIAAPGSKVEALGLPVAAHDEQARVILLPGDPGLIFGFVDQILAVAVVRDPAGFARKLGGWLGDFICILPTLRPAGRDDPLRRQLVGILPRGRHRRAVREVGSLLPEQVSRGETRRGTPGLLIEAAGEGQGRVAGLSHVAGISQGTVGRRYAGERYKHCHRPPQAD